jgi:N-terminal domain of anti-restriction factor ArdC
LAGTAPSVAPGHPSPDSVFSCPPSPGLFVALPREVNNKQPGQRRTGPKKMLVKGKEKEQSKIKSVRQAIRAGVELVAHDIEAGHPEVLTECLQAMAHFSRLSFGNILLISTQRPSARFVAGWRGWNELGRRVKQGEKGILIFAPILSEGKGEESQPDQEAGIETSQPQQELLGFRPVRVWAQDQVEGETTPESSVFASADLADTLAKLMEFAGSQGIQIEYSDKIAPAKGTSYRGIIRLIPDMEASETVSVLVRELAVQMLHETQRRSFVTRDVLLREAKAVAFVVGHALSFQKEAAETIQLYRGNVNLLAESLEVVQRVSSVILGTLSPEVAQDGQAEQQ